LLLCELRLQFGDVLLRFERRLLSRLILSCFCSLILTAPLDSSRRRAGSSGNDCRPRHRAH
jgi:hypothetical protein